MVMCGGSRVTSEYIEIEPMAGFEVKSRKTNGIQIHSYIRAHTYLTLNGSATIALSGVIETTAKVDLEVAKVDVSYIDSFVETHGFVAW